MSDATSTVPTDDRREAADPRWWTARARSLVPLVEAEAAAIEQTATITPRLRDALTEAEMFWLMVPEGLGGGGLWVSEAIEVVEELAAADASTGWVVMANVIATGLAAGFLDPEGQRELFDRADRAVVCGQFGPAGRAQKVDGGYRLTGRYQFASGWDCASWVGAGFVPTDPDGSPLLSESGQPRHVIGIVEKSEAEFLGNWDVSGLRGTGSYDYAFDDCFIPDHRTLTPTPRREEPVFRLGLLDIAAFGHCGVALGLMRRALEEVVSITATKVRRSYPSAVGDSDLFRCEFSRREAQYQAVRGYIYRAYREAEADIIETGEVSAERSARIRQATAWSHTEAAEVVDFAHRWAGTQVIRDGSVLGRISRDMAVATQHMLIDPINLVEAAGPIMARYRSTD